MTKGKAKTQEILQAVGGGFGSSVIMGQADARIPVFMNNKNLAPLANGALALGALYFMGDDIKPMAFGMLGASGSDFGNDVMNGLSRLSYGGDEMQGELEELEAALAEAEAQIEGAQEMQGGGESEAMYDSYQ